MNIDELNNEDLLDYYTLMVEIDYYDPVKTPELVELLRKNGVRTEDLKNKLLERLNNTNN